ncbi:hypothetical protein ACOME3_002701 [Neoechinorhynchus agilis]
MRLPLLRPLFLSLCKRQIRERTQRTQHAKRPSVAKVKDKWISSKVSQIHAEKDIARTVSAEKPVDNVWLLNDFPQTPLDLNEAVRSVRKSAEYFRLTNSLICARLELNMTTERKTKFLPNIRGLVDFPVAFEDQPANNVILFCKRDNHIELARKYGCYLYGHEDLIKMFVAGEIMDFSYDYILSTPDVYADITRLRKRVGADRFPTQANGQLVIDLEKALKKFRHGHFYESCKLSDALAIVRINIGRINLSNEEIMENFTTAIKEILSRHNPPNGSFIKSALLVSPPTTDRFSVDIEPFVKDDEE